MANFAFRTYSTGEGSGVLKSRSEAVKLREALKSKGHRAVVERSGSEHRVRVQHPEQKDSIAYVTPGDLDDKANFKPYWIAK